MNVEVANRLLDEAIATGPRCGSSHAIAIDGPAGSGKTTLAEAVRSAAVSRGLSVSLVHADEVCHGWDGLPEVPHIVEELLARLRFDTQVNYPTWDWHRSRRGPDAAISPSDVVIIEGVGSGPRNCVPYLSVRFFLDAPPEIRKRRALARDGDAFAPHWDSWAAAEAAYFAEEWPQD